MVILGIGRGIGRSKDWILERLSVAWFPFVLILGLMCISLVICIIAPH